MDEALGAARPVDRPCHALTPTRTPLLCAQLCDMVNKKQVYAKIDRPKGIVVFSQPWRAPSTRRKGMPDVPGHKKL